MSRAFSYLRFSTPEQAKGDSHRRQLSLATDYAARHGLDLDDRLTFADLGVSAFRGRNSETGRLGEFKEAVRSGLVPSGSYLLVESLDRISRQAARKALRVLEDIIALNITVVTLADGKQYDDQILDNDPMSLMMALMIFIRSNEESEIKSRRLKSTWTHKRALAETKKLTKRAPAWLEMTEDRRDWTVIPERAEVVRRIFDMAASGVGEHTIAARLNGEGIAPFGPGRHWHRSSVIRILDNPAVGGRLVPHLAEHEAGNKIRRPLEPIEGYFPTIVTDELRNSVAALRTGTTNPRRGRHVGEAELKNLLGGLARCPLCAGTLTRVTKGRSTKAGRPYLVCTTAKAGAGCRYKAIPQVEVEAGLLANLDALCGLEDVPSPASMSDEIRAQRARVKAAEQKVQRIAAAIAEGPPSRALRTELSEAEGQLDELSTDLRALAEMADVTDRRLLERHAAEVKEASQTTPLDRAALNTALRKLFGRFVVHYPSGHLVAVRKDGSSRAVRIASPESLDNVPAEWRDRIATVAARSLGRASEDGVLTSQNFDAEMLRKPALN